MQIWLAEDIARVAPDDPEQAFAWAMSLDGESVRKVERRHTFRLKIGDGEFFVKQHQGVMWKECLTDLLRFARPILGADNEFRMTQILRDAGVHAPEPAGMGYAAAFKNRQSFLITRALPDTRTLNELFRQWWTAPPRVPVRRAIIARLAESVRAMHGLGINHRDLYINHFRIPVTDLDSISPTLYMMDLHRAQQRESVPRRWLVKDLGALVFSSMDKPIEKQDALHFLQQYHQVDRLDAHHADLWRAAARRAQRMRARHLRKVGVDPYIVREGSGRRSLEEWLEAWL